MTPASGEAASCAELIELVRRAPQRLDVRMPGNGEPIPVDEYRIVVTQTQRDELLAALLSRVSSPGNREEAFAAQAVFVGWHDVGGAQRFQVVLEFPNGPPPLPVGIVWNNTPLCLSPLTTAAHDGLPSPPGGGK